MSVSCCSTSLLASLTAITATLACECCQIYAYLMHPSVALSSAPETVLMARAEGALDSLGPALKLSLLT